MLFFYIWMSAFNSIFISQCGVRCFSFSCQCLMIIDRTIRHIRLVYYICLNRIVVLKQHVFTSLLRRKGTESEVMACREHWWKWEVTWSALKIACLCECKKKVRLQGVNGNRDRVYCSQMWAGMWRVGMRRWPDPARLLLCSFSLLPFVPFSPFSLCHKSVMPFTSPPSPGSQVFWTLTVGIRTESPVCVKCALDPNMWLNELNGLKMPVAFMLANKDTLNAFFHWNVSIFFALETSKV